MPSSQFWKELWPSKVKESGYTLLNKNINCKWKRNGIENRKSYSHFERDKPCASAYIRFAN